MKITFDTTDFINNLTALNTRTHRKVGDVMDYTFIGAENQAKMNAPWRDRTGNARRSIGSRVDTFGEKITGVLGIGVFYGVWLEVSNQGRYRIVQPTLDSTRNKLISNLRGIL